MPEYPEVHTVINTISNNDLLNHKIKNVFFYDDIVLKNSSANEFKKFICNEEIIKIDQLGKFIIFNLSNSKIFVVHLRMEGKLFLINKNEKPSRFAIAEFVLSNGKKLLYDDFRKFGTFNIYKNKQEMYSSKEISKLGLEPFDKKLTAKYLLNKYKSKSLPIKSSLLDQTIFTGVGNVYADEILYACKINPLRKTKDCSLSDCNNIIKNMQKILKLAIKNNGTTVFSFKFDKNHTGSFQKFLKAYGQENKPCSICKTKMKKIKVGGRGTTFCPKCQAK